MSKPDVVVPVQLGCCPEPDRCLLCNPPPEAPGPEKVAALVAHYQGRAEPGDRVVVAFFGGPTPTDAHIAAVGGLPFRVRVRPDRLTRAEAARLVQAGCVGVELDALTFDDHALRAVKRSHRRAVVLEQIEGLAALGMDVGLVLAPGLPGTSLQTCLDDVALAIEHGVDTVRLHPVLVLEHAGLRDAHMDGRFVPLGLGDAVTACRAMMDALEAADIPVIRVGQQPGPDELGGRAVAGPMHSSLRELVEARRALDVLQLKLAALPDGATVVVIRCAPADVGRVRGPRNQHVRTLRADHALDEVQVRPDPALPRGEYAVEVA